MTSTPSVQFADVRAAADRIRSHVHRTAVVESSTLNEQLGLRAVFKCENLQKVGAFKARGAVNAVLSLSDEEAHRGVVTHSSGNHGQALAYAASVRGITCTVVMPETAPAIKQEAVAGYGARVVTVPFADRALAADREAAATGATMIHPFNDPRVIAGQGTAMLEVAEDLAGCDAVITPIGGGGLLSGTSLVVRSLIPKASLFGAEPSGADDAYRSFASGRRQPGVPRPQTIADGLLTGIGSVTFPILRDAGVRVELVDDDEIVAAARFHLERMKLVVEPSGATGLAALRRIAPSLQGSTVVVIISGGNTDFAWLER